MPATDTIAQLNSSLAGRYTLEREIGAGGMATVYLARDVKHNRRVALKVLKPELGAVLGVERFLAEIQVTANLQHPNLLPLFDSGEVRPEHSEGPPLLFYVMPFVEGESLRARLDREKQLPVDEAVHIAVAVAGALDYAHAQHVIHRDLKPENILMQAGQPVIADFGIALAVSKAGGARITQTGLSLGTPQYMSPEQATGDRAVDGRTDIYSLGAVTYEMLAGEPPHTGPTAQSIMAKLMTEDVRPLTVLRRSVPAHVDAAVRHALEKLPADRWATAHEFAEALSGARAIVVHAGESERIVGVRGASIAAPTRTQRIRSMAPWLVAAAAGAWGWTHPRGMEPPYPVRFELSILANAPLGGGPGSQLGLTPDSRTLVYSAIGPSGQQLYRRSMDQIAVTPIAGTGGAQFPVISPDSRWVAFIADSLLRKVPIEGGTATTIANLQSATGASWGSGDVIVLGRQGEHRGLSRVPAAGGTLRPVTKPDTLRGELDHRWPRVLADGKTVLYASWPRRGGLDSARIGIASLETGESTVLDLLGSYPFGVFSGYLVYARADGPIMAAPIDLRKRRVTGEPILVVDGVSIGFQGASKAALSEGGALVFQHGSEHERIVLVDMHGASRTLVAKSQEYEFPSFSPDGKKIAVAIGRSPSSRTGVWVYDIAPGTFIPLTAGDRDVNTFPTWTPDAKRVVFASNRTGKFSLWSQAADGSTPAQLLAAADSNIAEPVLSRDGRYLVYRKNSDPSQRDIWYRSLVGGDTTPKPLLTSSFEEDQPSLSPDGHWLAYVSYESGRSQVYVRAFPGPASKWSVSEGQAREPRWAPDGRRIFYLSLPAQMIAAHINTSPTFSVTSREVLFTARFSSLSAAQHQNYDVSPDGKQFVMLQQGDSTSGVVVVANWLTELRARLAANTPK